MEPLIKDTLNKGHLSIKDTFQYTNLCSGNAFPDNLSVMDKMIRPNMSVIQRFHCTTYVYLTSKDMLHTFVHVGAHTSQE